MQMVKSPAKTPTFIPSKIRTPIVLPFIVPNDKEFLRREAAVKSRVELNRLSGHPLWNFKLDSLGFACDGNDFREGFQ
jgi:hypothetical protein